MASQNTIERIAKLLRLAADQRGTPEGDTCQALADRLMAEHDVSVALEEEPEDEAHQDNGWATLGVYPERAPWRDVIVNLIAWLYSINFDWRPTPEGQTQLGLFDPELDRAWLNAAVETYHSLEDLIDRSIVPSFEHVRLPRSLVETIYKAGMAFGLAARLRRLGPFERNHHPAGDEELTGGAGESKALVAVRSFSRPRSTTADVSITDVPKQYDVDQIQRGSAEDGVWTWAIYASQSIRLFPLNRRGPLDLHKAR